MQEPSIWLHFALFVFSFVLVTKGANIFVEAAVIIAGKTGIPKILIGATIVSLATTFPEFSVSTIASYEGHPQIALGNAIGSIIFNTGFILGLLVILSPVAVPRSETVHRAAFLFVAIALLTFFSMIGQPAEITQREGLVLFSGVFLYIWMLGYEAYKERTKHTEANAKNGTVNPPTPPIYKEVFLFLIGAVLVAVGAKLMVSSGPVIARALGIPELIIALVFISIGTSLPELVTGIVAYCKGHEDLSVGNILGANTLNIIWVIGSSALIKPIPIERQTLIFDIPVMAFISVVVLLFAFTRQRLGKAAGFSVMIIYVLYLITLFTVFRESIPA